MLKHPVAGMILACLMVVVCSCGEKKSEEGSGAEKPGDGCQRYAEMAKKCMSGGLPEGGEEQIKEVCKDKRLQNPEFQIEMACAAKHDDCDDLRTCVQEAMAAQGRAR